MKYEYVSPDAIVVIESCNDVIRTSDMEGDNEYPLFPPQNPNPGQDDDFSGYH